MEVQKAFDFYKSWYFVVPILCVVLAITMNGASSKPKKKQDQPQEKEKEKEKSS